MLPLSLVGLFHSPPLPVSRDRKAEAPSRSAALDDAVEMVPARDECRSERIVDRDKRELRSSAIVERSEEM